VSDQAVIIRPVTDLDHNFIFATYLRNKWFAADQGTTLAKDTWMRIQHGRLEKLLADAKVPKKIACFGEDTSVILGYSFLDGDKLFTYVKLDFRKPEYGIKPLLEEKTK
jgi:hypothetical protein